MPGQLEPLIKSPGEVLKKTFDCSDNVADFGAISGVTATSKNADSGADSTAAIVDSSGNAGNIAYVVVKGGNDGEHHVVTIVTTFVAPLKTEDELYLTIDKGLI